MSVTTFTTHNQAPTLLDPLAYIPPLTGDPATGSSGYETPEVMHTLLSRHLLAPAQPGQPVTVTDSHSQTLDVDEMANLLVQALNSDDPDDGATARNLIHALANGQGKPMVLPFLKSFVAQKMTSLKLPAPSAGVIYSAQTDVIPSALDVMRQLGQAKPTRSFADVEQAYARFFVSLDAVYSPPTYGVAFSEATVFDDYTANLLTQARAMHTSGLISGEVLTRFVELDQIKLNRLTETLLLRKDPADITPDHSFARVLLNLTHRYLQRERQIAAQADTGVHTYPMPFALHEWIKPQTLVFANVEKHTHALGADISSEWESINRAILGGVRIMPPRALARLNSVNTAAQQTMREAAMARVKHNTPASRRPFDDGDFQADLPSPTATIRQAMIVIRKLGEVNRSQNIQKYLKKSLTRASRRHPDNPNVPGRIKTTRYLPDLHIYADTSGSIDIEDYQASMVMLMGLAQKLDINIYFSSFSHLLSAETLLPTKGKSRAQMLAMLKSIDKVSGATDYHQVWDYINASPQRRLRMNLMLTDFEFLPDPRRRVIHPPNMFYAPTVPGGNTHAWGYLTKCATRFANAMSEHDSSMRARLLGMLG